MDPNEAINQEALNQQEITVSLNMYEVNALLVLLFFGSILDKIPQEHMRHVESIIDKLAPGIYAQVGKHLQLKHDGLN